MRNICVDKSKLTPVEEQKVEIVERKVSGVREVYVWMLSKIGRPIDQTAIASVQIVGMPNIGDSCTDLTDREIPVC